MIPRGHTTSVCFSQECIFFAVFEKDSKGNLCVYLGTACFLENKSYGTLRTESPSTHLGSGSHTWTYKAVGGDPNNTVFHSRKKEKSDGGTKFIYLRRLYRTSKASPDFRQIVSYLEDVKGNAINNTALLQYIFQGEEHPFEVQPHGNRRKSSGPFLPTNKTTKAQMRDELTKTKSKKALFKLGESKDLLSAVSSAEVPCDRKQPNNFKHNERVKSTNGHGSRSRRTEKNREEQFIHNIASWPEPKCIFGYQYQFDDIARFCSNPSIHCLLTNDTTFSLGNFCVTPTSYRNILLVSNSTGKNPLS